MQRLTLCVALLFAVVTVCTCQSWTSGGGLRRCQFGSVGICGGFTNQQCPRGSYCRRFSGGSAGECCRTNQGGIGGIGGIGGGIGGIGGGIGGIGGGIGGIGGGSGGWGRRGRCPANTGIIGTCQFNPRRGSCLRDSDCRRGQLCCSSGCGRVCTSPNY